MLDKFGAEIYDELHKLRKYRNKIHIQDKVAIEGVSVDESKAFSTDVVKWSLEFCIRILHLLNEHFPRPPNNC